MNRHLLSSGTIACSALLLYSWFQAAASESPPANCDDRPGPKASRSSAPEQVGSTCPTPNLHQTANPEPQWQSDRAQLPQEMELVYEQLLHQAQTQASQEQFVAAAAKVAGIPKNSRHYDMARQLQNDWGREILHQATKHCQQAQMAEAMTLLDAIPATSPWYGRAVELRHHWQRYKELMAQANAARRAGDAQKEIDTLQALQGTPPYHSLLVQDQLQQALIRLYEPDALVMQLATAGLPTVAPAASPKPDIPIPIAPPETTLAVF